MIKIFKNKSTIYIFYTIAILVLIGSFTIYFLFNKTNVNTKELNLQSNVKQIDDLAVNISDLIKRKSSKGVYSSLKSNHLLIDELESTLRLLVTKKYKYVFVLDKIDIKNEDFRYLLDGSRDINNKSYFEEIFTPQNIQVWNSVYKTKKAVYFEHNLIDELWMTYIKPIIIDGKIEAIIVIDFSLEDHRAILYSFSQLNDILNIVLLFSVFIFVVIIIFSYIDKLRITELEKNSKEIKEFNNHLETKITNEVQKNREKDKLMIHQNRLAQMGEMISMIAHQWRQPLNTLSILNQSIVLKLSMNKIDDKFLDYFKKTSSSQIQGMSKTIEDFRNFFKPEKEMIKFCINDTINKTIDMVQPNITRNKVALIFDDTKKFKAIGYPNELGQGLLNIINNSIDALVENEIISKRINISLFQNSSTKKVTLCISDNANGIPKDLIHKIFDPYFSTKDKKNGTGLGLYMTKIIVEDHMNGKITAKNYENGAIFSIVLNYKSGDNNA